MFSLLGCSLVLLYDVDGYMRYYFDDTSPWTAKEGMVVTAGGGHKSDTLGPVASSDVET